MWLYRDSLPESSRYYTDIGLCDTPLINTMCSTAGTDTGRLFETDTGDGFNGTYINFNYRLNEGYAGYKIFWDCSVLSWDANGYDTLFLVHKGPKEGHEVRLSWYRLNFSNNQGEWVEMGGFTSSTNWKKETIPFSAKFGNKAGLIELRVIVYGSNKLSDPSDAEGTLKIDHIAFAHPCGFPTCSTHIVTPVLSEPPDFSTISGSAAVPLSWSRSDSATRYQIQVLRYSDTGGFTTILDSTVTATQLTIAVSSAGQATLFNWRVRALNQTDSSSWSAFRSFSMEESNASTRHRLSPAWPANIPMRMVSSRQLELDLPSGSTRSTLSMLNISGKKIAEWTIDGSGKRTVILPDAPRGIHVMQLKTGLNTTVVNVMFRK